MLHLVPLFDGGVLQLVPDGGDWVKLAFTSLEKLAIDEALVAQLVEKLSDPEDKTRQDAFKELTRYGPSAWPVLERIDAGPGAGGAGAAEAASQGPGGADARRHDAAGRPACGW